MSFNLDIALDEVKRLPVVEELKAYLVTKTHEFFDVAEEGLVDLEAEAEKLEAWIAAKLGETDTSPTADDVPFDGPSVGDGEIDPKATQAEEGVSTESDTAAATTKKGK